MSEWKLISEFPDKPMRVLFYTPNLYDANFDGADYGIAVGYFGGVKCCNPDYREQGTNHDLLEDWRAESGIMPTHWKPCPEPPK